MYTKFINIKVVYFAFLIKLKKIFNKKYDPYLPLPKKLFLSPSSKISDEYKNPPLKMSFSNSKIEPLKWQNIARKKLSEISGYNQIRNKAKISMMFNETKITSNLYRRKIYLKLSLKSDIAINLIYKKPLKKNL